MNPFRDMNSGQLTLPGHSHHYLFLANGLLISNQGGAEPLATERLLYAPLDIECIRTDTCSFRLPTAAANQSYYDNFLESTDLPQSFQIVNDEQDQKEAYKGDL